MMKQNWTYKRFDEVFDLQMGKTPDRHNPSYFQGENVWISIRDLGEKFISDSKEKISDKALVDTGIRIVKKGTVIMSFKLTVGKCGIAAKDLYTNEAIMAFNLKDGIQLESSFLYYYLQGYHWQGANKAVMGITLNKATISRHIVGIPPLPLQQSIVAELDNINNLINIKKSQLKDLDNLAQSIFYEMFGDPVENEKGWDVKRLGEVCSKISDGPFGSNLKSEHYVDSGIRVIRLQNIGVREFVDKDKVFISMEHYESLKKYTCYPNDVVIGTLGEPNLRACKIPPNINVSINKADCVHIIPNNNMAVADYFIGLLNAPSFIKAKSNAVHGQTRGRISYGQIKEFHIPLPPLPLQQKFAEKIEAIEKHKQIVNVTIKDLETLLASRMQFWFE